MGNLIEQLGGYEKTKEYLKENSCFMSFEALEGFYDTLLDYRQQHNIFEVDDKVVLLNWDNNSEIYNIKSVYEHKIYDGNQHSYSTFVYLLDGWCYERWFNNRDVRLATGEEIEAGRRL